jgi:hypothetical protein
MSIREDIKNRKPSPLIAEGENKKDYMTAPWSGGKDAEVKADAPVQPTPKTYAEMANELKGDYIQTEAEKAAEDKRLKRDALFSAIGDGISALSNIYFASKGAGATTNLNLSESARKRYDEVMKRRDSNRAAWNNLKLKAKQLDDDVLEKKKTNDLKDREFTLNQQKEDRLNAQQAVAAKKQAWQEKYQQGQLDLKKEQLEITRQYNERKISKMEHDMAMNELKNWENAMKKEKAEAGKKENATAPATAPEATPNKVNTEKTGNKGTGYTNTTAKGKGY